MRCRYCFDLIEDRTKPCPHCGSRQPILVDGVELDAGARNGGGTLALTRRQLFSALIGLVLIVGCLLFALTVWLRPGALPAPVIGALNKGTPIPANTSQATRAAILIPTAINLRTHSNDMLGFKINLPTNWLIVNQAQFGWLDEVRDLAEEYSWAETLFETGQAGTIARSRAIDPDVVDTDTGELVVFTIGSATKILGSLNYPEIPQLAEGNPSVLSELAGPVIGTNFTTRRTEPLMVNGRPATLVEFTSQAEIFQETVQLRVRLYFVEGQNEIFLVSYFAEQQLAVRNQFFYEEIVQSFEMTE